MQRADFKMQLKPGFEAEYRRRHDEIWPELSRALTEAGVSDYSIFLDPETLTLFAEQKLCRRTHRGHAAAAPARPPVVGPHGRHHGHPPGSLAGLQPARGGVSHGLKPLRHALH